MTNVGGFSSKKTVQTVSAFLLCAVLTFPGVAKANEPSKTTFTDIENHWAKKAILENQENGLISGMGKTGQFQPERYMTRGEFLTLIDRCYLKSEQDLFSLTLLTEEDEIGWGDGFRQPYLPYTDVDRMTWVYPSVLRVALVYDSLFGDHAFQRIFPTEKLHPEEPISRSEAADLMRLFIVNQKDQSTEELMHKWGLFTGSLDGKLKRGEAAVVVNRLNEYLQEHPILPLLDYNNSKFPLVPEITEIYPLFEDYGSTLTDAENTYVNNVNLIADHEDEKKTFEELQKLANSNFSNQLGVQYYLSWNQYEPLSQNLVHAFLALDQYLTLKPDKQSQETLRLLAANLYDLSLQIEPNDPSVFQEVLTKLLSYEDKLDEKGKETIAIYLAALETRSGKVPEAITRYQAIKGDKSAVLNAVYYLIATNHIDQAKQMVEGLKTEENTIANQHLYQTLQDEMQMLDQQKQYADKLQSAMQKLDAIPGYQATGESNLSGYLFHYTDQVDNRSQITHTNGYYKSPEKLVFDKIEMYSDNRAQRYYSYDFDENKWSGPKESKMDYVHEWLQKQDVDFRLQRLGARYSLQTIGDYDVITEWIPGKKLQDRINQEKLNIQTVKDIPAFITKYYIDRKSGMLHSRTWRYEETYTQEYVAYVGYESYQPYDQTIRLPKEAVSGTVNNP
ncbi:S-layer homology domain-containing protein [Brevibacillus ginsengisoli]|uniref:S-layer homology domain-containing protein n=1 Tax=Brevibacillus ginsengisoli TaxID=363854 RepID=UPI003CF4B6C3